MAALGSPRFQILSTLGEGGMGIVYDAYDRVRQMRLALKELRYVEAWGLYRFKREFRALSDLSHPNIISLYELHSEDNKWFLLMELIDGVDFVSHALRLRRSSSRCATSGAAGYPSSTISQKCIESLEDALRQLASALNALHSVGIVHRDLKPENVLVTREGRVVLMDFGIIAEMGRAFDQSASEEFIGTPLYMAPEQVVGSPASVAADWYGFGTMLYQALTGDHPYPGNAVQAMNRKLVDDPLPPSKLVSGIPADLEQLCLHLLARNVEDRAGIPEIVKALGMSDVELQRAVSLVTDSDVFVGRARELETLKAAGDRARDGEGQCVFIQGPSGIGKTALLDRFIEEREADDLDLLVLSARCHENESLAYKAFDGAIDELSNYLLRQSEAGHVVPSPRDGPALAQLFPTLTQLPGYLVHSSFPGEEDKPSRGEAVAALEELLVALAGERSVVLRIEDLHWADQDSLELLRELLSPAPPAGLLVVVTIRTAGLEADSAPRLESMIAALLANGACHRLRMAPLDERDQDELRQRWSHRRLHLPERDDDLWREAAGHPMLLAELAHHAQANPGEFNQSGDLGLLDLKGVVWRRVGGLSEKARALVELVAVAGEPTPLRLLGKAAHLTDTERERAASTLRIGRLVRQIPKSGRDVWIDSYHDKVRESVTQHLGCERNRILHGQLARVLEESERAPPARLGRHFAAAAMMAKATRYTVEAGLEAEEKLAFEGAAELYRQALAWMEGMDVTGVEFELCRAQVGLARCLRIADHYDDALVELERARITAETHGFRSELATIHFLLGGVCFVRVDIAGCLREHGKARELAHELASPRLEAQALAGLADAEYLRGHMHSSFRHYDECVQICRDHGFADIEVPNLGVRGFIWHCKNDLLRALSDCQEALKKAVKLGFGRAEAIIRGSWLSNILLEMGDLDAAKEMLRSALERVRTLQLWRFEAHYVANLGRVTALAGDRDEGERLANHSVTIARDVDGLRATGPGCLGVQALLTRDDQVRREALDEATAILDGGSFSHNYIWFYRCAIDATLGTGEFDETLRLAQAFEDYIASEPFPWARFVIDRGRALARYGRGHRDPDTLGTLRRLRDDARAGKMALAGQAVEDALAAEA